MNDSLPESPAALVPELARLVASSSALPRTLRAGPLLLAHHYLDLSPASPAYYQLAYPPDLSLEALRTRAAEGLRGGDIALELAAQPAQSDMIEWTFESPREFRTRVTLARGELALVLVYEHEMPALPPAYDPTAGLDEDAVVEPEPPMARPAWTFLTLAHGRATASAKENSLWHPSPQLAVEASRERLPQWPRRPSSSYDGEGSSSRRNGPEPIDIAGGGETYDQALERSRRGGGAKREMAMGEGTSPGALGNASDFWDGWSSDGGDDSMEHEAPAPERNEDDYWGAYGGVDSVVSPAPSPGPREAESELSAILSAAVKSDGTGVDAPPVSEAGSVDDVDDAEKPQPLGARLASLSGAASTRSRRSSTIKADGPPLAAGVASLVNDGSPETSTPRLNGSSPTHDDDNGETEGLKTALQGLWRMYRQSRGNLTPELAKGSFRRTIEEVLTESNA